MPFFSFPNPFSVSFLSYKIKKGVLKVSIYTQHCTDPRPAELSLAEPERELGSGLWDCGLADQGGRLTG